LHVVPTLLREGKKIQVVLLRLLVDDVEHVRATVLRLRDADLSDFALPASTTDERPADSLAPVEEAPRFRDLYEGREFPGFLRAVDMRRAPTSDRSFGCWVRLDVPVV